nr:putative nuclease HARBI1 [Tanacetum cinerariifolium]
MSSDDERGEEKELDLSSPEVVTKYKSAAEIVNIAAYFNDNPMFSASLFEDRYRMSRSLFTGIVEEVTLHCAFFREKEDCTGKMGISPLIKFTSAIHQLAYGTVSDALDVYLQMGYATSR